MSNNTIEIVGRNDLCPCGSNKKFKKCCGKELYYEHIRYMGVLFTLVLAVDL